MTYLTQRILQKPILRSRFLSLALTSLVLIVLQTIPAKAQQRSSTPDPNNINSLNSGNVGIGTSSPAAKPHVFSAIEQLRLGFDASNHASFTTSSAGDLTMAPTAGCIGTTSPGQRLSVVGVIESTTGGFKFPDGTTQTTSRGGERFMGEFPNFSAAISTVGSAPTTLVINSVTTVSTNVTVPSTLNLRFTGPGSLSVSSSVTLTIADGNSIKAGPQQIFSLSGTGTIRFTKFPDVLYPEWWGAKGDDAGQDSPHSGGATDNLAAFNAMTDSVSANAAFTFASTKVQLSANRVYYLSNTWNIRTALDVGCEGGFGWAPCAYLRFPSNTTKVIVHALSTFTGNTAGGDDARWVKLHNFGLLGPSTAGPTTHTVDISGLTLTKTAGANFADNLGYHEGNTVTVNGFTYQMNALVSTAQVTLKNPRILIIATNGSTTIQHATASGGDSFPTAANDWNGSTFSLGRTTYTISTVTSTGGSQSSGTAAISPAFGGTTGTYTVSLSGASVTAGAARPNLYHGVDARGTVWVEGMYIKWTDGNGINLDSSLGQTSLPGTLPNTNNSRIIGNYIYTSRGNGIYTKATNANQMSISNNDASNNYGAGVAEFSFLGNNYYGNHYSFNGRGSVNTVKAGVNVSNFSSEYSEGGQPSEYYGQNMIVLGGNHGAGVSRADSDVDFKHLIGGTGANGSRDPFLFAASDVATGNIGGPVKLLTFPGDNFYQLTLSDRHVIVNAGTTAGQINFLNPTASTGRDWTITLGPSTTTGTVSFLTPIGNLDVSGLNTAGDSVTLFSDGTNWRVKSVGGPTTGNGAIVRASAPSFTGLITTQAGIKYVTATRPTCASATRGTTWYVAGGTGVADTFEICRKDAADIYAWATLF